MGAGASAPHAPRRGRRGAGDDRAEGVGRGQARPEQLPQRGQGVCAGSRPGDARQIRANEAPRSCRWSRTFLVRGLERRAPLGASRAASRRSRAARRRRGPGAAVGRRAGSKTVHTISPDEAQPVEPLALVALHASGEQVLLPHAHREVLALQQLQRGEDAGRADQAVLGMQVMAAQQERRELLGGRHRPRAAGARGPGGAGSRRAPPRARTAARRRSVEERRPRRTTPRAAERVERARGVRGGQRRSAAASHAGGHRAPRAQQRAAPDARARRRCASAA